MPGPTLAIPADVTYLVAVDRVFGRAEHDWGAVEVLIASAWRGVSARIERTSDADWNRMLELNLTAPFRCLRRAAPAMRAAGYGRIVVIASTALRVGELYLAAYTASQARGPGAGPGGRGRTGRHRVDGERGVAWLRRHPDDGGHDREHRAQNRPHDRAGPLGAGVQAADRAADHARGGSRCAVWFCAASEAITGQAINVDGGAVQS